MGYLRYTAEMGNSVCRKCAKSAYYAATASDDWMPVQASVSRCVVSVCAKEQVVLCKQGVRG